MGATMPTLAALNRNLLLGTLDDDAQAALLPQLQHLPLVVRDMMYTHGQPISHAYFPLEGVISMVAAVEGGPEQSVEVATVGNEGMVGLPLFLGTASTPGHAFVQVPGEALRMTAEAFVEATRQSGPFSRMLHRYLQAMFTQISQSTACNRMHPIHERAARWLLQTHDRVSGDRFALSQQFLGQMLGEGRPAVNIVASMLQRAGFIDYQRGVMRVLDRPGLESAACLCYGVVRDEYDRMLGRRQAAQSRDE